jgi:hypothetical protein
MPRSRFRVTDIRHRACNRVATPIIIFAMTMANIVIVSLAAFRGVEYMDSVQFCG